ncbi:MAG: CGNR zinc finger domain-containing protein [Acidimicrobiia bacterium]
MDFSHYTDEPVQLAVDLVNTREAFSDTERLNTPEDVAAFLDRHTEGWFHAGWSLSEADLHEVRALRARLRSVFGAADVVEAARGLNEILTDVEATPRVSTHSEEPHLHFEPTDASPSRWLGAVTAMGLGVALIEGGIDRIGVCASATCDDVYVDGSRNRSRRHCSDTCTTRENVAAYRRRQRDA